MLHMEEMETRLKNNGYKLTKQRKAILEVFIDNPQRLLTADEIYEKTIQRYPGTNFSTVYRNLDAFVLSDILMKVDLPDSAAYEPVSGHSHEHLIICKSCGMTEPIQFCPYEEIRKKLGEQDFTFTDHKFELYGYCKRCNKP